MNEEKEAIAYLSKYIKSDLFYEQEHYNRIEIVLNYIDKLQQELKDSINARFELQKRIDKLQKENEEQKKQLESRYYHTINVKELEKEINNNWEEKIERLKNSVEEEQTGNPYDFIYMLNKLLGDE